MLLDPNPNPVIREGCAQVLLDPAPQSGLDFGSALAIAADASSIVVGAGGRVQLGAISGGSDSTVDGRVRGKPAQQTCFENVGCDFPGRSWKLQCFQLV